MDVNNFGSAFMPVNAFWCLAWFLLGGYFPSEGSVGAPCQISPWVELAATSGKCCALLTAGLGAAPLKTAW